MVQINNIPQGPEQQPEQGNEQLSDAAKLAKSLENLDSAAARAKALQLMEEANADQVLERQEIGKVVLESAQIAFDELGEATAKTEQDKLLEVNGMFTEVLGTIDARLTLAEGKLQLSQAAPKTKMDYYEQKMGRAMEKMQGGDIKSAILALAELIGIAKAALGDIMSLGDPYVTEQTREDVSLAARQREIKDALKDGTSLEELQDKKEAELAELDVAGSEQLVKDKKAELTGLETELGLLKGDKDNADRVKELSKEIAKVKQELDAAQKDLTEAKAKQTKLEATVKDIKEIQQNIDTVKTVMNKALATIGERFKEEGLTEGQRVFGWVFDGCEAQETADLTMKMVKDGTPLGEAIRDKMREVGVAEANLPNDTALGLGADGSVKSLATFQEYFTLDKAGEVIRKAEVEEIYEEGAQENVEQILQHLETSDTAFYRRNKIAFQKALRTPNEWITVDVVNWEEGEIAYINSELNLRCNHSNGQDVFRLDPEGGGWKYVSGTINTVNPEIL